MRNILVAVGVSVLAVALWLGYAYFRYIDDTVTAGKAYGLEIGMSRSEALVAARQTYNGREVYILHPVDEDEWGPHVRVQSWSREETRLFSERERWALYFDQGFFDVLKLKFRDDVLVEIHRHRKVIEGI